MDTALTMGPAGLPDGFAADERSWVMAAPGMTAPPLAAVPPACVCFATSGSTGAPSWVVLSKSALVASAGAVNRHLHVTAASRWGLALPVHHVGGFGVLVRAQLAGGAVHTFPGKWNALGFTAEVARQGVTHASLVPTQVHDLVAAKLTAPPSLVAVVVGGARLDKSLERAARALGWPVLASYGMTETSSQVATQSLESLEKEEAPEAMPVLDIWRVENGQADGLRVAGPALCLGWMRPGDHGTWSFVPREGEWFSTQDRAEILPDGTLCILGRADELVKVLGELVSPQRIESQIMALEPGVRPGSFAVIARPHDRAGHCLVPVFSRVVDPRVAEQALTAYHASCPGYLRLVPPVFVEAIPLSPLGKVLRTQLAESLADRRNE
jgi:o-succinylbenzoate---CoA ligase